MAASDYPPPCLPARPPARCMHARPHVLATAHLHLLASAFLCLLCPFPTYDPLPATCNCNCKQALNPELYTLNLKALLYLRAGPSQGVPLVDSAAAEAGCSGAWW